MLPLDLLHQMLCFALRVVVPWLFPAGWMIKKLREQLPYGPVASVSRFSLPDRRYASPVTARKRLSLAHRDEHPLLP